MIQYAVYFIFAISSALFLFYTILDGAFLAIATLVGLSVFRENIPRNNLVIVSLAFLTAYILLGVFLSYFPLVGNIASSGSGNGQKYTTYIWDGKYTYDGKLRMLKSLAIGFLIYIVGDIFRTSDDEE